MKNWLKFVQQVKKNYPAAAAHLNEGASVTAITALERHLGCELPSSFRELYSIADGERDGGPGCIFGLRFLPIQEILKKLDEWREVVRAGLDGLNDNCTSKPKGAIQCVYAHQHWLPLFGDGGGNCIGIDLAPAAKGTVGQIINFGPEEEDKHVLAKDLDAFIGQLAKIVGWAVVAADDHGGFAVNEMHFIDAIKTIRKLPSKNPEDGYYSVWLCPGNSSHIPDSYFYPADNVEGKNFMSDFGIEWQPHYRTSGSRQATGEPAPLEQMLKYVNRAEKFKDALGADAAKLGIGEVGYVHIVQGYLYTPDKAVNADACVRFVGCYKVS